MKVELQVDVAAPLPRVWEAMDDIPLIASCVPGATLLGTTEEGLYKGRVTTKVGPVSASFTGEASVERFEESHEGHVIGKGRDKITGSGTRAEMRYKVMAAEQSDHTIIQIQSEITLSGVLAQFGKLAVINEIAKRISQQFAENLGNRLNAGDSQVVGRSDDAIRAGSMLWDIASSRLSASVSSVSSKFRKGEVE